MTNIADLPNHQNDIVGGVYRLTKVQNATASNNKRSAIATLEDSSGSILCHDWEVPGSDHSKIGSLYSCCLLVHCEQRISHTELMYSVEYENNDIPAIDLLPFSELPNPDLVSGVKKIIEDCPIHSLRRFLLSVFDDPQLALGFFKNPASKEHHHAFPGGLCAHSIEVVNIAQKVLSGHSIEEYWTVTAACLLHDIGKAVTMKKEGKRTKLGFVIPHDDLTLEILATPLRRLERKWEDGAIALRYLLTYKSERTKRPLLPSALTVKYADQMSAAYAIQKEVFEQKPQWQRFAKHSSSGPTSMYWRPLKPTLRLIARNESI